jgi:release factor glutamine methyltransferase
VSNEKAIWTVIDIIRWGTEYFGTKGVDSPRLTIELILSDTLQCSRLQLYLLYDRPLTNNELSVLRELCKRRGNREPLQYLLGKTSFYGLDFEVSPSVLIPRPDTETIIDGILQYCQSSLDEIHIHDLGTGSGCIAIALAHNLRHRDNIKIYASDISEHALEIAKRNAQKHEVDIEFSVKNILAYSEPIQGIVVSNPPYIGQSDYLNLEPELAFEPRIALTDEYNGLLFYTAIAKLIESNRLNVEAFFLEIGFGQSQDVENLFTHLTNRVHRIKDLSSIDRVIWGLVI